MQPGHCEDMRPNLAVMPRPILRLDARVDGTQVIGSRVYGVSLCVLGLFFCIKNDFGVVMSLCQVAIKDDFWLAFFTRTKTTIKVSRF